MRAPQNSGNFRRNIRIDCGKYLVRTIKPDDASDRWAAWIFDPGAADTLNLSNRSMKKADIAAYIKRFDQWSQWLLGIFEKQTRAHIGIIRIDVDYAAEQSHINVLIGEPQFRNKGVTADVFMSCLDYVFETVGLSRMTASALARNQVTIRYLLKAGWTLDHARASSLKSSSDGTALDVCLLILTRDAWREWKKTKIAARLLRRIGSNRQAGRGPAL